MSIPFRPILSALLRNRTGAVLVALQIAIALAVLVNAVYIVKQRSDRINRPVGMDIRNILVVSSAGFAKDYDYMAAQREDFTYIRSVKGVTAVSGINSVPLSSSGSANVVFNNPTDTDNTPRGQASNWYEIDEHGLDALGLHLIAGRNFRAEEIEAPLTVGTASRFPSQVIVTKALADALFPGQNPIGKTLYNQLRKPSTIIGVVEHMQVSWQDFSNIEHVFLIPRHPFSFYNTNYYIVHVEPGQLNSVARTLEEHLSISNPGRTLEWVRPLQGFKDRSYSADHNMQIFLVAVTTLLVAISMLGIFGLATFNVSVRTKQIGTRRAIGARRADILGYFMVENAMITTAGILVGCGMALGVGYWLSLQYQLPRLDLYYLVGGIPVLWLIGQLAIWQPARKASAVSPSVATRTV